MLTDTVSQEFEQNITRMACLCPTVSRVSAGKAQHLAADTAGDSFTRIHVCCLGWNDWKPGLHRHTPTRDLSMWLGPLTAWQLGCSGEGHKKEYSKRTRQKLHGLWWHSPGAYTVSLLPFHHTPWLRIWPDCLESSGEDIDSTSWCESVHRCVADFENHHTHWLSSYSWQPLEVELQRRKNRKSTGDQKGEVALCPGSPMTHCLNYKFHFSLSKMEIVMLGWTI